jgi:hypothetical protein
LINRFHRFDSATKSTGLSIDTLRLTKGVLIAKTD